MVEAIGDPRPERMHFEEDSFLAKLVELRIAVKKASGDELVENAHDKWRKDSEKDIVEGQRPRLENDLAGKCVLK